MELSVVPSTEKTSCKNLKTPVSSWLQSTFRKGSTNDDSGYFTPSPSVIPSNHSITYTDTEQNSTRASLIKTALTINVPEKECQDTLETPKTNLRESTIRKSTVISSLPFRCTTLIKTKQHAKSVQNFDRLNSKHEQVKIAISSRGSSTSVIEPHGKALWSRARHVDFLKELNKLNLKVIISEILNNLSELDLCAVCCVCKVWQTICCSDPASNSRRKYYITLQRSNIENVALERETAAVCSNVGRAHSVLGSVENEVNERRSNEKPDLQVVNMSESRLMNFYEEGQKLGRNQRLDKCPRCSHPAYVNIQQNRAKCSFTHCAFNYCTLCRCEVSVFHHCSPVKISSRKKSTSGRTLSKNNLKRLLK